MFCCLFLEVSPIVQLTTNYSRSKLMDFQREFLHICKIKIIKIFILRKKYFSPKILIQKTKKQHEQRFNAKILWLRITVHDLKYIDGWVKTFCIFPINKYAWGICGVYNSRCSTWKESLAPSLLDRLRWIKILDPRAFLFICLLCFLGDQIKSVQMIYKKDKRKPKQVRWRYKLQTLKSSSEYNL